MTGELVSAHLSDSNAHREAWDKSSQSQHAPAVSQAMQGPAPFTSTAVARTPRSAGSDQLHGGKESGDNSSMAEASQSRPRAERDDTAEQLLLALHMTSPKKSTERPHRITYLDFATQYRSYRQLERQTYTRRKKVECLRKSISLSARLTRVGSWIHDGLVEISEHADSNGFVRLYQHMKDLADVYFTYWGQEIQNLEEEVDAPDNRDESEKQLRIEVQRDLLDFVNTLRTNPRFVIDCLRRLTVAQIAALFTSPRYRDLPDAVLSSFSPGHWQRLSQKKRIKTYSKILEDHATAFERCHPLSFMLFNCFGPTLDLNSSESVLRFKTWSSIGAGLFVEHSPLYDAFMPQVFRSFVHLAEWRAKEEFEMYLMDVLQKGSFLLNPGETTTGPEVTNQLSPEFETQPAQEFFDQAVKDLFMMLAKHHDGIPSGPLRLCQGILRKLSSKTNHSRVRGHFFFNWFLDDFLLFTIQHPENEKIMLNFHVNETARRRILLPLWDRARLTAIDVYAAQPSKPIDPEIQSCIHVLIEKLDDEYEAPAAISHPTTILDSRDTLGSDDTRYLTICAADVIHTLDSLRAQKMYSSGPLDPFVRQSTAAFHAQYSRTSDKYEKLRQALVDTIEPGFSSSTTHPSQEQWITFTINSQNGLELPPIPSKTSSITKLDDIFGKLDLSQSAALRLSDELKSSDITDIHIADHLVSRPDSSMLSKFFDRKGGVAMDHSSTVEGYYWHRALQHLWRAYPSSHLTADDTRVLAPLQQKVLSLQEHFAAQSLELGHQVTQLENIFRERKKTIAALNERLDLLRIKMWYMVDVVNSNAYEDAKNLSSALNNMAMVALATFDDDLEIRSSYGISGVSTSNSSMMNQARADTINILKAPTEEGGPKKLAEAQINKTKAWLSRNNVANFCIGEERIHRFCMEIRTTTTRLVGENLNESPVLWASELFHKERTLFDINAISGMGGHTGSSAASVMSDPLSSSTNPARPTLRQTGNVQRWFGSAASLSPARKTPYFSIGSSRVSKDTGSDLGSSFGSPDRSNTASTGETASSFWSYSRSGTSTSLDSRAPSIYNDAMPIRSANPGKEKRKFLQNLLENLTCLLLSDLGCLVWSCGSETDGWMDTVQQREEVIKRLKRRYLTARLASEPGKRHQRSDRVLRDSDLEEHLRRSSIPGIGFSSAPSKQSDEGMLPLLLFDDDTTIQDPTAYPFEFAFEKTLSHIGQQVDPLLKLQKIHELEQLVVSFIQQRQRAVKLASKSGRREQHRRHSLDSERPPTTEYDDQNRDEFIQPQQPKDHVITQHLQRLLQRYQPKTIFRDLQFVAAFVPSTTLKQTPAGQAFLRFGLAVLGHKDEVCRSLVDVADKIIADDLAVSSHETTTLASPGLFQAAEYWIIAAKEGNPIAQRELASLYLSQPEILPIVSLPMSAPSSIFRGDMMWEAPSERHNRVQALRLALHWMQQAKHGGDEVARKKMEEREFSIQ